MNKHIMVLAVIIILLVPCGMVHAQHLVIAASEGANVDIPVNVITEAYKRIGLTIEIRQFPAERAIQTANSGDVDGEIMRQDGIEQDYPNLLKVPVAIKTEELVVVTKDKKFVVEGWNSLVPYKVGYVRGVKAIEMNLVKGTYAEAANTGEQAYRKLDAGRTDVVIDVRSQAQLITKALGMDDLIVLEPPLLTISFFHYLHAKNQQWLQPLTTTLQQMENEGLIQRMYQPVEEAVPSPST